MLILVDGVDCSGKSTLVAALAERLAELYPRDKVEVLRKGPPAEHPLDEYERPLWSYRPGHGLHIVCDRWHLGEWVYPAVLGRPTRADDPAFAHIELLLRSRGALLVFASPPACVLARRYDARGDDLVRRDQLLDVDRRFTGVVARSLLPVHTIFEERTFDRDVTEIVGRASQFELECSALNRLATYVGPPNPQLLLLGDVRHEYRECDCDPLVAARAVVDPAPAFVPYPGTSGHFLLRAVSSAGYRHVGLLNANDVDDAFAGWKLLGRPRQVVALGRQAQRTASRWRHRDLALGAAPHPQFVRRFAHGSCDEYGRVVALAATQHADMSRWHPAGTWFDREVAEVESGE